MTLTIVFILSAYIVSSLPHLVLSKRGNKPVSNIDGLVNHYAKPVPFGHILKTGIDDLEEGFKQPYDLLELDMRMPRTRQEEEELLNKLPDKRIVKIRYPDNQMKSLANNLKEILEENNNTTVVDDIPKWFDFEGIQSRNINNSPLPKSPINTRADSINQHPVQLFNPRKEYSRFFSVQSFDLLPNIGSGRMNWTTCDEFVKGIGPKHVLHPRDIVNIDWVPFYVWAHRRLIAIVHRFSFPTKKIVKEYKETYGPYLNKSLDWQQPKLILNEEMEMLLIAGDRKGLFHAIPRHSLPFSMRNKNISLPTIDIRMKIEDPYLAMMYCDDFYATIMASPGTVPQTAKEKMEEASLLKFKGKGYPVKRDKHLESLRQVMPKKSETQKEFYMEGLDY
ncbi:hypothetical protein ACJJTC_006027 [Scirpophaga incertulas]